MQFIDGTRLHRRSSELETVWDVAHRGEIVPGLLRGVASTAGQLDERVERGERVAGKHGSENTYLLREERLVIKVRTGRIARRRPVEREFHVHRRLHAAGVSVPRALAYLRPHSRDASDRHYLVLRALPSAPHARDFLLRESRSRCRSVQVELGRVIGELHESGWTHGDLTLKNVLVPASGRPLLIDLDHAHRPPAGLRRLLQLRDLRDVWISQRRTPATSDFDAVLRAYAAARGMPVATALRWGRWVSMIPKNRELFGSRAEVLRDDPTTEARGDVTGEFPHPTA